MILSIIEIIVGIILLPFLCMCWIFGTAGFLNIISLRKKYKDSVSPATGLGIISVVMTLLIITDVLSILYNIYKIFS